MPKPERLIKSLRKERLSLALAESCSSGYASYLLTKTPGASKVFKGTIIVYSLYSKNKFFHIPYSLLEKKQGVSGRIALTLAKKVKDIFKTDIGAAIVGFAGPKAQKGVKVGTTFLAVSAKKDTVIKKIIKGSRDQVRKKASHLLLDLIYESIYRN